MAPHLSVASHYTYQRLIQVVSLLEKNRQGDSSSSSRPRRDFYKKAEAKAVYTARIPERRVINTDTSDEEDNARGNNRQVKSNTGGNQNNRPLKTLKEMQSKPVFLQKG